MLIKDLIGSTMVEQTVGSTEGEVLSLTFDSRACTAGCCFFALRGNTCDGHAFIGKAIEAGARVIVCEEIPSDFTDGKATAVVVRDSTDAMADIADAFYGHPSSSLGVIGVTGTNGKTTIATLLYNTLQAMGHKSGLISTVVYRVDGEDIPSTHTTPDSLRLNQMMRRMVDCGTEYCIMECSSHAIAQRRIRNIRFRGGMFTNLTHDHLDFHHTFAEYRDAKKLFFDSLPKDAFAVTNIDDPNGEFMLQNCRASRYSVSLQRNADFNCKITEVGTDGMQLRIDGREVWMQMIGRFNAYNVTTIYAAAVLLGFEREEVLRVLSTMHSVSGRMEFIRAKDSTTAIVDYAHTPDALQNVLRTIADIRRKGQRIITVCGCGGDRDRTKRPEMAVIAVRNSDIAIFTSDNPRTEDPEAILDDMVAGVAEGERFIRVTDRSEAIRTSIMLASPGDIILIAGKGHEDYQIVGKTKHHFDDRECVREWFEKFNR